MAEIETAEPPTIGRAESVSFWRIVVQSLKGEHHDYTSEHLNRAVLLLAIPMVLEMLMESLFAVADVFWVSHLGRDAVAIVGITESIMTIIYAVAIGISMAATALVARRIGEKDPERAAHASGQVLLLGGAISAALGIVLGAFAPDILRMMGGSDSLVAAGTHFTRIMLGGNISLFLLILVNAAFRGAGNAVIAMRTLWLANAINILLGPCFIFGWGPFPQMGVTGAAIATNIGRGIGVIYQVWHLLGHYSKLHVHLRHLWPDRAVITSVCRMAWSGVAQFLISTTSWIGLIKILSLFGNAALAGYTISVRVVLFALLPAWGLSNAGATLVGQNLGAKKPGRAESSVWIATGYNTVFLGIVGILFVAFATPIISLFTSDPDVLSHGSTALWIVGLGFPLYAAGMCMTSAFNGAGDTWTPTWLNFFCFWLCEIPLGWLLATQLGFGPTGVFIAIPIAFSILAIVSMFLFRRGRWKATSI
jgi:putative MATE family efflux protein